MIWYKLSQNNYKNKNNKKSEAPLKTEQQELEISKKEEHISLLKF